jgi:putative holliday junction resolvase
VTRGKLLGIDHGLARIGLAVSDASGLVARELTIIKRKSKQEDFEKIKHIAAEQRVVGLVVGLPSNFDSGTGEHTQADTVRHWVEQLTEVISLPVVYWDEQMSSVEAHEMAKRKRRKPQERVDDLAARVILQSYLDAVRDGLAQWPVTLPPDPNTAGGL